jgi:acyl-CoA thioesterase
MNAHVATVAGSGEQLAALERVGDRDWLADFPSSWSAFGGIHGGAVIAVMLDVAAQAGARRPATVSAHLHAAVAAGPVRLAAEIVRSGGSATSVTVSAHQQRLCATALVLLEGGSEDSRAVGMPLLSEGLPRTAPEETAPLRLAPEARPPVSERIEIRPSGDTRPLAGGEQAVLRAWIRPREPIGDEVARAVILLDALAPSLFAIWRAPLPVPTIELSAHFAPAAPPTPWSAISQRTVWWNDGYCVDEADLRNEDGALIAQARQRRRILRSPRRSSATRS